MRLLGILLVIFGVVLGVYGLAQWKQLPTRAERREQARRIFPEAAGLDAKEIDQVRIERDGKTLVFERRDGRWQMTEPINVLADRTAIDNVVRDVKDLELKVGGLVAGILRVIAHTLSSTERGHAVGIAQVRPGHLRHDAVVDLVVDELVAVPRLALAGGFAGGGRSSTAKAILRKPLLITL